jgi:NAD(P) transhydrogenase
MAHYDLIVIGSGPAGEKAAAQAAYFGKRVAIIEREPQVGGAAVNTGTLPSKTLRETALFLSGFRQRGLYGVNYKIEGDLTVERFLYRTERVVEKERELVSDNILRHQIDVVHGRGSFVDAHTVRVEKSSGCSVQLTADCVLVATGSYPYRPPHIPFDDRMVWDSDTILRLDNIPKSLTILGAGVIGCEYACLFGALGVEVVLVDARDQILPFVDREIIQLLGRRMTRLGIQLMLEEEAETIEVDAERVRTRMKSGREVVTENLLYASGRSGNTRELNLDQIGVEANKRGQILVNENYQTSVEHVYAAGDVIGFPSLASASMEQGRIAICHAFQLGYKTRLAPHLPYGIYTIPEISTVGETEETLKEKEILYEVGRSRYGDNPRGQIIGDTEGLVKLVFSAEDTRLLGVHIIGENASELIHTGMVCMYFNGTLDCFIQSVFNYPTLSDLYKYAAYDGLGRLARSRATAQAAAEAAKEVAK